MSNFWCTGTPLGITLHRATAALAGFYKIAFMLANTAALNTAKNLLQPFCLCTVKSLLHLNNLMTQPVAFVVVPHVVGNHQRFTAYWYCDSNNCGFHALSPNGRGS